MKTRIAGCRPLAPHTPLEWQATARARRVITYEAVGHGHLGSLPTPDHLEEPYVDAIALLKADHEKVKKLLAELETTTDRGVKTRTELFATIKGELTVHEIIEEEIFYPELKAHPKGRDIVLEGYEEHHVVDVLMNELERMDVTDERWGAKAIVMKENIEHHIEEEEGEMFAKAHQVFDRAELLELGERMAARKLSAQTELNIPVTAH